MDDNFKILDYISGLTPYIFDKAVLKNIAYQRGVQGVLAFEELSTKTIELIKADLLYMMYITPTNSASMTQSHGSFSQSIGSQKIDSKEKERIFNIFSSIYKKYGDAKLQEIEGISDGGDLQWLEL